MKTYEFEYKDTEGDIYTSDIHQTLKGAKDELKNLQKQDEDVRITQSWIYKDGKYAGSWH